jgi:hypothetical protein
MLDKGVQLFALIDLTGLGKTADTSSNRPLGKIFRPHFKPLLKKGRKLDF